MGRPEEALMDQVTVFVDDAVLGRLPAVCAKTGGEASVLVGAEHEVGESNRLGILWLLVFLGPLGWLVVLLLLGRDRGERLAVRLPYSDVAHDGLVAARRLRRIAVALLVGGTFGFLLLTLWADLGASGLLLAMACLLAGVTIGAVAEWRVHRASVAVGLDASRRWVTLRRVHPAFVAACAEQRASHPGA